MDSRGNLQRKCVKAHPKAAAKCSSRCIRWYPDSSCPAAPTAPAASRPWAATPPAPKPRPPSPTHSPAAATASSSTRPSSPSTNTWTAGWTTSAPTGAPAPWPATPPCCATTSDPSSAPGRSSSSPRWRSRPSTTSWPSTDAGTASRAGWPPAHPGRAPLSAPRPGPGGHLAAARPQPRQPRHPTPGAPHRDGRADTRTGRHAAGRRRPHLQPLAWPLDGPRRGDRGPQRRAGGLEWADLDLHAGTIQFRQALTIIDPAILPDADPSSSGRRRELAVGPLKSTASNAILTLPPFAAQALHQHRRQQARTRLALGQPATVPLRWVAPGRPPHPVELDLVFCTERGTPVNPNHASRAFARLAAGVGLAAHPHLLRHALASAMAANKEPASIIAAQLRHADGGALAQRVYIHQLPQTAPRLAGVIEGVFGPAARDGRAVSAARRAEGVKTR